MTDQTKKRRRGRPPINGVAMTNAERCRRRREKRKASGAPTQAQVIRALRDENARLQEVADVGRQLVVWYVRPIGGRVIGAMSPSGLCDPGEVSRTWERFHKLINGDSHES